MCLQFQSALPLPRGRYSCYASFPNVHNVCLGLMPVQCKEAVQVCSHAFSPQTRMAVGLCTLRSKHENCLYISLSHKDFPKCAEQQGALKQPVSSSLSKATSLKDHLIMGTDCLFDLVEPQFHTKPCRCLRGHHRSTCNGGILVHTRAPAQYLLCS